MITLELGDYRSNCYIIKTGDFAFVIDPGGECDRILKTLTENRISEIKIINTHSHIDHWLCNGFLKRELSAEILISEQAKDVCFKPDYNLSVFNEGSVFVQPDQWLKDTQVIKRDDVELKVINTPGHTVDGICLETAEGILTGDTLFAGSVGRSDLPGGDHDILIRSIKERLLCFPDNTAVFPGHGVSTTIGEEKRINPFL